MKSITLALVLSVLATPVLAKTCSKKTSDAKQAIYMEALNQLKASSPKEFARYEKDISHKQMAWMKEAKSPCALIERMTKDLKTNYGKK